MHIKNVPKGIPSFERCSLNISFGSLENCRKLLWHALLNIDPKANLQWLPEYEMVAQWMSNNKGKGLFLTGDCGRGKTNIIAHALPYLFARVACFENQKHLKILQVVHIDNLHQEIEKGMLKRLFYVVDEIGAEPITNYYGSKYFPFMSLLNRAESERKFCLFSSNLNAKQIEEKYDTRTVDRLVSLCHIIRFQGKSLRK